MIVNYANVESEPVYGENLRDLSILDLMHVLPFCCIQIYADRAVNKRQVFLLNTWQNI